MKHKPSCVPVAVSVAIVAASLMLAALGLRAETTIFSDDFNRAALGGSYTISQGGGGGTAFIVTNTVLFLTNGTPGGWVSVATNVPAGSGFSPTLDSCSGLVTWTFNMRFGRTGNTPSGFTTGSYGNGYVLAAENQDFSASGSKGYAVIFGNNGSPDTFRLVAFTNGIRADYLAAGLAAGNALVVGTGAFSVTTQTAANDYYSFKVTYDPPTKIWTFYGRDDGSGGFADPASGSFTTIGTFTETSAIFRATALGRTGAYWVHSTGANNPSQFDNFKLTVTPPGPSVAIDNTGTPLAGNIVVGTMDVPVFGFRLTPSGGSVDFTGLNLTTAGTAAASDLSNFRVVYDADNSGTYNGGDSLVSGSGAALANPITFTLSGQTGFSAARRYLVIADVAGGATGGATFTGSIAAPGDVTTTSPNGTALGNQQTIASVANDLTMTGGGESVTISSLINDTTISTSAQGAQAWQVTFTNAAGNAGAATISAVTFAQGANNQVTNWQSTIQAAELFDGSTALAAGTISPTNIVLSGLSAGVADGGSKTLTLRISLKSSAGVVKDNTRFQFTLSSANVTVSGNGVTTASISSDQTKNQNTVVATKLAFSAVPSSLTINQMFNASVQARDANDNLDLDDGTVVTLTKASGSGTLSGGGAQNLASGVQTWTLQYSTADTFAIQAAGGSLAAATSGDIAVAGRPLAISGYMANPTGNDSPFEYVQVKALQAVDFSLTPMCLIWANNGTATADGWVEGGGTTYKFNLTSGTLAAGDVAYVGGSGKVINGTNSADISGQNWLRTIDTATSGGDGFGTAASSGVMGNGGANADGIAIFLGSSPLDTSTPVDAVFYGAAVGAAVVSGGMDGYVLPVNDMYNGGFLQATNTFFFDPASGAYAKLSGTYNTNILQWTVPRTATSVASPTAIAALASGITLVGAATAGPAQITVPSNGAVSIKFFGVPSNSYAVQTTTNLAGQWAPVTTNTAGNDGSWIFTDQNATNRQQFYRIKVP